ncbi:MAG: hypothetical protein MI920_20285, partial [Kiloniellales bacterium]|nr:hypothetical protein [Kiloniellales bacterium]
MHVNPRTSDRDDGTTIVALPSRLEKLRENLDQLAEEAAQLGLPLASNLVGAASEAVTDRIGGRSNP